MAQEPRTAQPADPAAFSAAQSANADRTQTGLLNTLTPAAGLSLSRGLVGGDLAALQDALARVMPEPHMIAVSAKTGEGIADWVAWLTGQEVFDPTIYYFSEIPTAINPVTIVWVGLGAIAIAVLASVLPALRAARLHPVEALRYE